MKIIIIIIIIITIIIKIIITIIIIIIITMMIMILILCGTASLALFFVLCSLFLIFFYPNQSQAIVLIKKECRRFQKNS